MTGPSIILRRIMFCKSASFEASCELACAEITGNYAPSSTPESPQTHIELIFNLFNKVASRGVCRKPEAYPVKLETPLHAFTDGAPQTHTSPAAASPWYFSAVFGHFLFSTVCELVSLVSFFAQEPSLS